jgi:hypothetical protein
MKALAFGMHLTQCNRIHAFRKGAITIGKDATHGHSLVPFMAPSFTVSYRACLREAFDFGAPRPHFFSKKLPRFRTGGLNQIN